MGKPAEFEIEESSSFQGSDDLVRRFLGVCLDGYPFISGAFALTFLCYFLFGVLAMLPMALVSFWTIWFFRDPQRKIPDGEGVFASPADGKVIAITESEDPYFNSGKCVKICIFMNIFNVHVNRIPFSGKVTGLQYKKGKFLAAYAEKASVENEQMAIRLETTNGMVVFSQIAGLVARRIVCRLQEGQRVEKGQRFGLIRFGSRVDIFLPKSTLIRVREGEMVQAGATILGEAT